MNGKYGKNQWKVMLFKLSQILFVIFMITIGLSVIYNVVKPKYTEYQDAKKQKELEEQAELERQKEQAALAEQAALEEQRLLEEANKTYISTYEVVIADVTWEEAKSQAEAKGGHLAVITSEEEQKEIENRINQFNSLHTVWLGALISEGSFAWINGEEFSYTNWASGEPNNETGDEIYLDMYEVNDIWRWNDVPNDIQKYYTGRMGYVIEWEIAE